MPLFKTLKKEYSTLKQRREGFVRSLASIEAHQLRDLCHQEVDFLSKQTKQPNSLKTYITAYRTLIRHTYGKEHPALLFFKASRIIDDVGEAAHYTKPLSRQVLVEAFADKVAGASSEEEYRLLWDTEFRSLHELTDNTKKLYLNRYYRPILKQRLGEVHPIYKYLQLPKEVSDEITANYRRRVIEQHKNLITMSRWKELCKHVEKILLEILESENQSDVSIVRLGAVLLLLTGRRPYEIFCAGDFSPVFIPCEQKNILVTSKWSVMFEGQVKTREREGTKFEQRIEIPVLTPAKNILKAMVFLRESPLGKRIFGISNQYFTKLLNSRGQEEGIFLRHEVAKIYSHLWSEEDSVMPKSLRPLYAEIAYKIFVLSNRVRETKNSYFSRILGHSKEDLTTSHSYMRYVLDDYDKALGDQQRALARIKTQLENWKKEKEERAL